MPAMGAAGESLFHTGEQAGALFRSCSVAFLQKKPLVSPQITSDHTEGRKIELCRNADFITSF